MSKERLKQIFDAVQGTPLWSMQLIKVKAEREGVTYHDREICLRPEGSISFKGIMTLYKMNLMR